MALSNPAGKLGPVRPSLARAASNHPNGVPAPPIATPFVHEEKAQIVDGVLELSDGTAYRGVSFGAGGKSVAGECVFQTGEFL
jgi:carbamoyl-phosphate synthase / aspartate carbamoyltransferase